MGITADTGVIFDLDGTLVNSALDIHAVTNALLQDAGHPPLSLGVVRGFIGNGIPALVRRVMTAANIAYSPERHRHMTQQFEGVYGQNPARLTTLYPDVLAALDGLKGQGLRLGICTNKTHALTLKVLRGTKIAPYFGAVVGGDSLPMRKPDPMPLLACAKEMGVANVIYIGDSEVDAQTAAAANVPFLLYTKGYRKGPVDDMAFDAAFDDFTVLGGLVKHQLTVLQSERGCL